MLRVAGRIRDSMAMGSRELTHFGLGHAHQQQYAGQHQGATGVRVGSAMVPGQLATSAAWQLRSCRGYAFLLQQARLLQ